MKRIMRLFIGMGICSCLFGAFIPLHAEAALVSNNIFGSSFWDHLSRQENPGLFLAPSSRNWTQLHWVDIKIIVHTEIHSENEMGNIQPNPMEILEREIPQLHLISNLDNEVIPGGEIAALKISEKYLEDDGPDYLNLFDIMKFKFITEAVNPEGKPWDETNDLMYAYLCFQAVSQNESLAAGINPAPFNSSRRYGMPSKGVMDSRLGTKAFAKFSADAPLKN